MTVLHDIVKWSKEAPPIWVRDALRRIVSQPTITQEDCDMLATLCKQAHGLATSEVTPVPLEESHIPASITEGPTTLVSLTHVADVNALAPGSTLRFGDKGLTVVYGDNGAGKSGYARILKRACRARGSGEAILPNALSDHPAGTPTAKLSISTGGVITEHTWTDGKPGPRELAAVSVFDASAAQVYVASRTEVRFRPLGLDVLDKMADVCTQVRDRIAKEQTLLEQQATVLPTLPSDTEAGKLLQGLSALTPEDDVRRIASLSDEESAELSLLENVLASAKANDPTRQANDYRTKATRISRLLQRIRVYEDVLGKTALHNIRQLRKKALEKEAASDKLTSAINIHSRLAGLGHATWHQMWMSAEAYSSATAYAGIPFPAAHDGALCVLCQQNLSDEAKDRLGRFAELVRGEAQQEAKRLRSEVAHQEQVLANLSLADAERDARADLSVLDEDLASRVEAYITEATKCRDTILADCESATPLSLPCPHAELQALINRLNDRATALDKTALPEERKRAEQRERELRARSDLSRHRDSVLAEVRRKARLNAYAACASDADTRSLTRLSTDLTKRYVTNVLVAAFDTEIKKLGFSHPEIELRAVGGQKGLLYHQVQLRHATKAELPRVVSEGESRCIALAAFLAELQSAGHASAIVFDDPVSSLDHRWRDKVAERLVEEAGGRQVVVFTHELVFLIALQKAAEKAGIPFQSQTLSRQQATAGHVDTELPWSGQTTTKRIRVLKDRLQYADKVFRTSGSREYAPIATDIYAKLRQTWERAVEEVLLNGAVERFRRSVETNRLKAVDLTSSDIATIEAGMTKASRWEGGHDHSAAANDPQPSPDDIRDDIKAIEDWVDGVHKRRKNK